MNQPITTLSPILTSDEVQALIWPFKITRGEANLAILSNLPHEHKMFQREHEACLRRTVKAIYRDKLWEGRCDVIALQTLSELCHRILRTFGDQCRHFYSMLKVTISKEERHALAYPLKQRRWFRKLPQTTKDRIVCALMVFNRVPAPIRPNRDIRNMLVDRILPDITRGQIDRASECVMRYVRQIRPPKYTTIERDVPLEIPNIEM